MKCKKCGSFNTVKYGTKRGIRVYKCRSCNRSFQELYKRDPLKQKVIKEKVLAWLEAHPDRSLRDASKQFKYSHVTIYKWKKQYLAEKQLKEIKRSEREQKFQEKKELTEELERRKRIEELGFEVDFNEDSRFYLIDNFKITFDEMRIYLKEYFPTIYNKHYIAGTLFQHRYFNEEDLLDIAPTLLKILRKKPSQNNAKNT